MSRRAFLLFARVIRRLSHDHSIKKGAFAIQISVDIRCLGLTGHYNHDRVGRDCVGT